MKIKLSTAITIIVIIISAFLWQLTYFASSGEVQSLTKDVRYIELFNLNRIISNYEDKYNCYLPQMCLPRMNEDDRKIYRILQENRGKLLEEIEGE